MNRSKPIIAIDGPVGVGKSTVARQVAYRLDFVYIDTGAMYRAIALKVIQAGIDFSQEDDMVGLALQTQLNFDRHDDGLHIICDGVDVSDEIRLPEVSAATSPIADHVQIRAHLVSQQQEIGADGGIVMEGRDIGTVVFPDAELKVYLDADPKIRAQRRYDELVAKGKLVTFDETYEALLERDERDRTRPVGALRVADDAQVLDTTSMTTDEVIATIVQLAQKLMVSR